MNIKILASCRLFLRFQQLPPDAPAAPMVVVPPPLLNKAQAARQKDDSTMHEEMRERIADWMLCSKKSFIQTADLVGLTSDTLTNWYYGTNTKEAFEAVQTFSKHSLFKTLADLPYSNKKPEMQSNEGAVGTGHSLAANSPGDEGPVAVAPPPTPPRATQSSNLVAIEKTKSVVVADNKSWGTTGSGAGLSAGVGGARRASMHLAAPIPALASRGTNDDTQRFAAPPPMQTRLASTGGGATAGRQSAVLGTPRAKRKKATQNSEEHISPSSAHLCSPDQKKEKSGDLMLQ
jgi:hypothetical protein